jgi:acyl dehydratase
MMTVQPGLLHYEDFHVGMTIDLGEYPVKAEEIVAFANEFDPHPFHLDHEAGKKSILGGLCASGWHSCAMLMRMLVDGYLSRTAGMGSNGVDEVKWLKPVFAGETLKATMTVLAKRVSSRKPDMGILTMRADVLNAHGERKMEMTAVNLVKVRHP